MIGSRWYFLLFMVAGAFAEDNKDCECRDWYGDCRRNGDKWIDDETWSYGCAAPDLVFIGCVATSRGQGEELRANTNTTINDFWFSCTQTDEKLRYEQEAHCEVDGKQYHIGDKFRRTGVFQWVCLRSGIWIVGCFAPGPDNNATGEEILIEVDGFVDVGLVRHNCQRISEFPGRVQYWTSLKPDSDALFNPNTNRNQDVPALQLQDPADGTTVPPQPWLNEYVADYIKMDGSYDIKIRYLI